MKKTKLAAKSRFSKYPQISIRTDKPTIGWLRGRAALSGMTLGEALEQLRIEDEKKEIKNAAKRASRK